MYIRHEMLNGGLPKYNLLLEVGQQIVGWSSLSGEIITVGEIIKDGLIFISIDEKEYLKWLKS